MEQQELVIPLRLQANDADARFRQHFDQIVGQSLDCAHRTGWRPAEPVDFDSLLRAGHLRHHDELDEVGSRRVYETARIRLQRAGGSTKGRKPSLPHHLGLLDDELEAEVERKISGWEERVAALRGRHPETPEARLFLDLLADALRFTRDVIERNNQHLTDQLRCAEQIRDCSDDTVRGLPGPDAE